MDITYYLAFFLVINTVLWIIIIYFSESLGKTDKIKGKKVDSFLLSISLLLVIGWLYYIHAKIGFLPYGPDTKSYTYMWTILTKVHHWIPEVTFSKYYYLYHTSCVSIYIIKIFLFNTRISFFIYLLLLTIIMILTIHLISRRFGGKYPAIWTAIFFLLSPPLLGADVLQQYTGMIFILLSSLVILLRKRKKDLVTFLILIIVATITHLSPFIFLGIFLVSMYLSNRGSYDSNDYVMYSGIVVLVVILYNVFSTSSIATLNVFKQIFINLIQFIKEGLVAESFISTRAYGTIPSAKNWLYSWSILPSFVISFIIYNIIFIGKLNKQLIKQRLKKDVILIMSFLSLLVFSFSGSLRFIGVDILRYGWTPTYYVFLVILVSYISRRIVSIKRPSGHNSNYMYMLIILSIVIITGLYSGLQDPHRTPWNGGLRLSPTDLTNRKELESIAVFSAPFVKLLGWHGIYYPKELTNSTIVSGTSFYPVKEILEMVAKGIVVEEKMQSHNQYITYYILPITIVKEDAYMKYDLVFISARHELLLKS